MSKKLDNVVEEKAESEFVWPRHLNHEIEIDDQELLADENSEEMVEWIERKITKPGQYFKRSVIGEKASLFMEKYIESLYRGGLDIGKGETLYGYKMPLPQEINKRDLIIFRRKD